MRERIPVLLKVVCLALAALLAAGIRGILSGGGGPERIRTGMTAMSPGESPAAPAAAGAAGAKDPAKEVPLPELPPRYRGIAASGVLGAVPVPPEPRLVLVGIAGDRAFIQVPGGGVELLSEGGEAGGIKVLRIAVNRVLVEHKGKQIELNLFSGLGSDPLLPQDRDRRP